jgi:hypothetical protein
MKNWNSTKSEQQEENQMTNEELKRDAIIGIKEKKKLKNDIEKEN